MPKTSIELLVEDIKQRQIFLMTSDGSKPDKRNKSWMLWDKDPQKIIELTYGHILLGIERKSTLLNIVTSVGACLNRRLRLKVDEIAATHLGWFVLISYFETGILDYFSKHLRIKGRLSKYPTYQVKVTNLDALNSVMDLIDNNSSELFPVSIQPEPWGEGFVHKETGRPLIKSPHEDAVAMAKELDLSYIKETLNKLQSTAWRINKPVFSAFEECVGSASNPFKFSKEIDPEKRASLLIEIEAIRRLATRNIDNAFYHLYNLDFRGRIYPNTAFLHEQSSDNAKGLLILDEPVCLGEEGYYWLSVHTANMWGNDKVSLDDRAQWVQDNMDDILLYAEDPMQYVGWMDADKPFCFLACCYECSLISNWHGDGYATEDFPSCLPVYIDGSNNGVQHLVAMSKDEYIAPLVNLVPQDLPGDVYMFIAEHTQKNVKRDLEKMDPAVVARFDDIHPQLVLLRQGVGKYSPGTELYRNAMQRLREFSNSVYDIKKQLGPVFWSKVKNKKTWRKTVKRPVMTLGYGGTKFGMVDMVDGDTRDLSEYLRDKDKSWSAYLGHLIFDTCYEKLEGPARMLRMFEALAERENNRDTPITFVQNVTNFPFVHSYKEAAIKRVKLYHGDNILDLHISVWKESTLKKSKQKTGAAPNIVHSVDAVHLSMYVHDTDYQTTVVHDSFGCHAGNMSKAFIDVRNKFVELYDLDPLEHIMSQMESLDLIPEKGNLDVSEILSSDFAFA